VVGARGPKQKFTGEACPNKECGMYGQEGKGNVVGNGTYMARNGRVRKFICHHCEKTFTSAITMLSMISRPRTIRY